VAVVARAPVGLGGVRARARRRVAGSGLVALVRGRTRRRATAHAGAVLARVGQRAGVAVVARAPIGLGGVRTRAGGRVAGPDVVALVSCRADDRVPARARALLLRVGLRACVAVVARAPVGLGGVRAGAGGRVAGARIVALVLRGAHDRIAAGAGSYLAGVGSRAGVAIVAGTPVGLGGVRAGTGRRAARPRVVTLVACGADDGIPAGTHAALAGVGVRARVAVVARAPVGLGGVRARAGGRVAGPRVVALVLGDAHMTYLRVGAAGPRRQRNEQHQEMEGEGAAHGGEPYLGRDGP